MLKLYNLNSVSSEKLVDGIALLNQICLLDKPYPDGALDFYELFYLVQNRKAQTPAEIYYFGYIRGYAIYYEEDILGEIMEEDGLYMQAGDNEALAYQLQSISQYFADLETDNYEVWEIINYDMTEIIISKFAN
ncbi:MAG: hypothetical protein LBR70_02840 [Lactobacillaceae bacterium]|jgi:hypothetical protein|nr:hypothetical protein [Lactobacillaceae bacterium]